MLVACTEKSFLGYFLPTDATKSAVLLWISAGSTGQY